MTCAGSSMRSAGRVIALEAKVGVDPVLDDEEALAPRELEQAQAPLRREVASGRVVQARLRWSSSLIWRLRTSCSRASTSRPSESTGTGISEAPVARIELIEPGNVGDSTAAMSPGRSSGAGQPGSSPGPAPVVVTISSPESAHPCWWPNVASSSRSSSAPSTSPYWWTRAPSEVTTSETSWAKRSVGKQVVGRVARHQRDVVVAADVEEHLADDPVRVALDLVRQRVELPGRVGRPRLGERPGRLGRRLAHERALADPSGDEPELRELPVGARSGEVVHAGELRELAGRRQLGCRGQLAGVDRGGEDVGDLRGDRCGIRPGLGQTISLCTTLTCNTHLLIWSYCAPSGALVTTKYYPGGIKCQTISHTSRSDRRPARTPGRWRGWPSWTPLPSPQQPLLVALADGELQAAISMTDGAAVADPFAHYRRAGGDAADRGRYEHAAGQRPSRVPPPVAASAEACRGAAQRAEHARLPGHPRQHPVAQNRAPELAAGEPASWY